MVGSKNEPEGILLGEMVAQHLERRLDGNVRRQLSLGNTAITYQALLTGQIALYPEYSGLIETEILKETPNPDPAILIERARGEMNRVAQSELLDSLGFDSHAVMAVQAVNAPGGGTLSAAADGPSKWKIGVSFSFQDRSDGLPALNHYRLPLGAAVRAMDGKDLFPALLKGDLNMIATTATDGHLASNDYKVLADDKKAFPAQFASVLVRKDKLADEPRLKGALQELTGKITVAQMRKWNAQVDVEKKPVAEVAATALAEIGLH